MDRSPATRSALSRADSEDSPVEFITVADSDMSDVPPATPEKKAKKKRSGLSFKKIRSSAQKLIPGVRRTKKSEVESPAAVTEIERDTDTPSPPLAPIESPEPAILKSTESLPAIKEDPREVLGGTRSDEDMLAADGKARQKKVRKPSRAASFMKKLAGRAKSSKVAPNAAEPDADAVSSGTLETPLSIKRQTPEGAILNVSESELYPDTDGDDGTSVDPPSPQPAVALLIRQLEAEPRTLRPKRTEMKITLTRNTDDIEIIDGGGDGGGTGTANIETGNGRLRSGGSGVHRQSPQNESSSLSSAKPISPFPQPPAAGPIATQSGAAIAKESFGVEQSSVTQSRPVADQQRLSSLLSGDYIAEINKFSIEKLGSGKEELPPPPVPSPRGSLSIREKFFHPLAPPSATAAASSSVSTSVVVGGDESTEDFMRKSKGAAAAAGRSKGGGAAGKGSQASKEQSAEQSSAGGEAAVGNSSSGGGGAEGPPVTTTTTVRTQEAAKPYQLGNSLKNPNNSGFKSIEGGPSTAAAGTQQQQPGGSADSSRQDDSPDGPGPKIVFDIGTQVRPDRTSTILAGQSVSVGQTLTAPLVGGEGGGSGALSGTFSSFGGSYDGAEPASDSQAADGSRRRIAYVEQPTFYTPEEEELLTGKASSLLSSALESTSPEYSLESADYLDSKMPPHGDLLLEKGATDREVANMAGTAPAEKREHLYKILVIGELGTGKTSFIKRYVHQFFSQNYRATIGVDFALKVLNWDQSTIIRLQLWDIAGQERFGNMTRVYYKEAVGAFIVFDVTRSATFDAVIKWKQDLDSKVQLPDGKPIPCILLANKSDQQKQGIVTTPAKLDEYVKEHGFAGWFETSAKENVNIEEAAKSLVNKILMNDKLLNTGEVADSERFALAGSSKAGDVDQKKSCPC